MPDAAPQAPAARPFRLASWNMNHWQTPAALRAAAWAWLADGSGLDAALLQETVPPPALGRDRVVYREIAGRRPWGSAVVALGDGVTVEEVWSVGGSSRYRHRVTTTYPGSVAVARVSVPGIAPITVASVYNLLDGSPAANLLRVAADLLPLLDSADGDRVVVAGDLNVYGAAAAGRRGRTAALFRLLDDLGLHPVGSLPGVERPPSPADCPCGRGGTCGHIPTWRGVDLDHAFVTGSLRGQVRSLDVERSVVDAGWSDHAALVLGLELDPAPAARPWDADSFVAELGARHGPGAAQTAAALVAWAEQKEDALRAAAVRDRKLTEFEIPKAVDPTLYVGLTFHERGVKPQWLFSVHAATAALDVSFQYMGHPPFDTEAGREPVRAMLNGIAGVAIPASRLRGRPRIPLAALADPAGLPRLLAALDMVVDGTRPTAGSGAPAAPDADEVAATSAPT